jgi:hypothetical protein
MPEGLSIRDRSISKEKGICVRSVVFQSYGFSNRETLLFGGRKVNSSLSLINCMLAGGCRKYPSHVNRFFKRYPLRVSLSDMKWSHREKGSPEKVCDSLRREGQVKSILKAWGIEATTRNNLKNTQFSNKFSGKSGDLHEHDLQSSK